MTFVTAGDPDYASSLEILKGLPAAGADVIELGMPFTDPMADGPAIQLANIRALDGGQTLARTLQMVREFRSGDSETPLVLMGYFNPIHHYGVERFIAEAKEVGGGRPDRGRPAAGAQRRPLPPGPGRRHRLHSA